MKGLLWAQGSTGESALEGSKNILGKEWFAITAFPLFAGTFGPIATALNICSLVHPWRCIYVSMEPQHDGGDIPDPGWLIGLNVLSLVFGFAANIAMLPIRHDRKEIPKSALVLVLINIVGGMLAAIILICLVIAASISLRLPSPPDHAFTEAYYYAIMAAGLYFITSSFVIYTAFMLWKSRKSKEEISKHFTGGHRSLKLLTIMFMAYLMLGALVFKKIEGWRYMDAVFWADVTILTIGFGDFKPETHLGRALLFPYAVFGVFILFLVVYCITRVVLERGASMWEIRLRDEARIRRVAKRDGKPFNEVPNWMASIFKKNGNGMKREDTKEKSVLETQLTQTDTGRKQSPEGRRKEERDARERDFEAMQEILENSLKRRILYSFMLWGIFALFLWLFGAALFYLCERSFGWTYFRATYFTFISLLAIGYGDVTLTSMPGKAIFVLWSLMVVPTLTMLITIACEAVGMPYLKGVRKWLKRKLLLRSKKPPKIKRKLSVAHIKVEELPHNTHDRNHLLIQAIKSIVIEHMTNQQSGEKKAAYSFEDWEYIFYLMGVFEADDSTGEAQEGNINARPTPEEEYEEKMLDWLHGKNPLNVSETLTEWMLLELVSKLEKELDSVRRELGNTHHLTNSTTRSTAIEGEL